MPLALPKVNQQSFSAKQQDCNSFVTREEWGARPPDGLYYMGDLVQYLFIHHSAGNDCYDKETCMQEIRNIQNYHMDSNGWPDIGYRCGLLQILTQKVYHTITPFISFLIGGDGLIYEGRGWNQIGAHTYGFNDVGYGIDFIGTFTDKNPTQVAQDAYFVLAQVRN